jgi:predicted ATPase/class 3 adenylate cyclase
MKCPVCNYDNTEGAIFCGRCGTELAFASLSPEGRRFLTILFVEITGLKTPLDTLDHKDATAIVDFCTDLLTSIIKKYSGKIHKCMGEFIVGLFGIPQVNEDDAERTIKAALSMAEKIPEINGVLSKKYNMTIDIGLRIGVNNGTMIVRWRDATDRKEFIVIGEAIDLAASLKNCAKIGEIVVSEPVFNASRYLFEYQALPDIPIKSGEKPVKIFKPVRIKPIPDPKYGIAGLYSALVGREKELKLLFDKASSLLEGKGGAIFILSEAGVGKTRLWIELKDLINRKQLPITMLEGDCMSFGEAVSNWPFLQVLRSIFEISEADPVETTRDRILGKTKELIPENWATIAPYIAQFFSIRFSNGLDERVRHLSPQALRQQIMSAIREILFAMAKKQPVLLAFDDYHWIDPASSELLEYLFKGSTQYKFQTDAGDGSFFPLLFIGLSRIEKELRKSKEQMREILGGQFFEMTLAHLDNKSSNQLLGNLLKISDISEKYKRKILEKAGGNPLYLEEIIRSLIDNRIIFSEMGTWNMKPGDEFLEIPTKIQTVIHSRLDRLDKDARDLLNKASVIGRTFHDSVLVCMTGVDRQTLSMHLAALEKFDYIKLIHPGPEPEYAFKHPLVQEVIYNTLSLDQLKKMHQKVGQCMETVFGDSIANYTELLSHQFYKAEEWSQAYDYSLKAARKSKASYLNKEAIFFYNQALRSIRPTEEESPERQAEKLMAAIKEKVDILYLVGENEEALAGNNKGLAMAKKIGHKKFEADFHLQVSDIYGATSAHDQMLSSAEKALAIYREINDQKGQSESLNNIGVVYDNIGNHEKAFEYYNEALKNQESIGDLQGAAVSLNNIGYVYNKLCNYDQAFEYYGRSLKIQEDIKDRKGAAITLDNIGGVHSLLGGYAQALDYHKKSLNIKMEIGDRWGEAVSYNNIGYINGLLGNNSEALDDHLKSLKIKEEIGDLWGRAISLNNIGHVYAVFGEFIKSFDCYHESMQLSERIGNRYGLAISLNGLGRLLMTQERFVEAREYLVKADRVARETGSKEIIRRVLDSLGKLEVLATFTASEIGDKQEHLNKAEEYVKTSLTLTEELKSQSGKADALLLKAVIENIKGGKEKAKEYFETAIAIFERLQMLLELAIAYYYYSEWHGKSDSPSDAQVYLHKAKEIFEKINAKDWLRKIGG